MSKIVLAAYGPRLEAAVADKTRMTTFIRHVEKFLDKNSPIIFAQGPTKPLLFANTDKQALFDLIGIPSKEAAETELRTIFKQVPNIRASWKHLNDPFVIISVYLIRELMIKGKEREREIAMMFLAMKSYSTQQKRYFPHGANDQVMAFTLNSLSDKFKYKELKNNYAVVKNVVANSHDTYKAGLAKGEDEYLNIYFPQMYNRTDKVMQNIAREYYANYKSKNYLNSNQTTAAGDTLEYEDSASLISSLAESTAAYFMSSTVNMNLARTVADRNNIPYVQVFQTLMEMRKQESPDKLKELVANIVTTVYEVDTTIIARICSKDFAVTAIRQLSVSNSSSTALAVVKNELDRILDAYCSKYAATQRLATKMAYRNAIYSYLIYILIANRCK